MPDDLLDKLGEYFVYHSIGERYRITFEQFLGKVRAGTWEAYLAA
ncbi:hypothetical protein [Paenibacillus pinihumi]|nr:hypothetical protein [Paenibacillus pinihumi]